jgi:hypothetical protein
MLLLDNAPLHPKEGLLKSEDGKIGVKYLPTNVMALIQPMDQGVMSKMKHHYRLNLLQKYADECYDTPYFWKQFTVFDAIYDTASAWNMVTLLMLIRSWRKLIPDISEDDDCDGLAGFSDDEITTAKLTEIANQVSGGKQIDEDNITERLELYCV